MYFQRRLLALRHADVLLRTDLAAAGELFHGYHPRIRTLHEANARELELIIDDEGWPTPDVAGDDGAEAAWSVVMDAISRPAFMRRCLGLLRAAVARGQVPPRHAALLEDRIRMLEGRPQDGGSGLGWDDAGQLSPLPLGGVVGERQEIHDLAKELGWRE
jgi:hypothetical protein